MRPSRYLPTLEVIWCLLTIAMACVQSVKGVYIIRCALGLAEAGFYPGVRFSPKSPKIKSDRNTDYQIFHNRLCFYWALGIQKEN